MPSGGWCYRTHTVSISGRGMPVLAYSWTLNNYTATDVAELQNGHQDLQYLLWGHEVAPTTGTPHLQGYLQLRRQVMLRTIKNWGGAWGRMHFENAKGTDQENYMYCRKIRVEDAEPNEVWYEMGERKTMGKKGARNDLQAVKESIDAGKTLEEISDLHFNEYLKYSKTIEQKIRMRDSGEHLSNSRERLAGLVLKPWQTNLLTDLASPADPRKITWIWSAKGGTGKSTFATYLTVMNDACPLEYGKRADLAHIFAGTPKKIVVFDLTRKLPEHMEHIYSLAEALKRGWMNTSKYDSRVFHFEVCHVVFFANCPPDYQMWSEDRYDVRNID